MSVTQTWIVRIVVDHFTLNVGVVDLDHDECLFSSTVNAGFHLLTSPYRLCWPRLSCMFCLSLPALRGLIVISVEFRNTSTGQRANLGICECLRVLDFDFHRRASM